MRKKILVLVEKYLESGYDGLTFVHARLVTYPKDKFDITVLSFSAQFSYQVDDIEVVSPSAANAEFVDGFDIILSHAPNLRNHLRFLIRFWSSWRKIIFYIHGHEALTHHGYYPKPYDFVRAGLKGQFKQWILRIYDPVKLLFLNCFFRLTSKFKSIQFVFVSQWMQDQFEECVKFQPTRSKVIANPCHPVFEKSSYITENSGELGDRKWLADFVTIRSLDNSKYGIDLVCDLALKNPDLSFHIYGCGRFFEFNKKPSNVVHINRFLRADEIPEILKQYRMAIMPTRLDAQGVMACEMATFGIPLLTTDLSICREMLESFPNTFFNTESLFTKTPLSQLLTKIYFPDSNQFAQIKSRFSANNTTMNEVELIAQELKQRHDLPHLRRADVIATD